jgi:hypothetical protein
MVNSSNGFTYAAANGDVLSNRDIVLNARATVFGDALPGPGHSVTFATDSYVSGSTTPSLDLFTFDPVQVPSIASTGPLTVPDNTVHSLPPGAYGFGDLSVGKNARLAVKGPAQIVCTNFTGGKLGRLVIDATEGPVTIYVQGTYKHMSGFESVAAPGSPLAVAFMLAAPQDVTFPASTKIRGAYYGPETNFTFTSDNEVWGAIAANRIDMSNDMKFHFDESLMDHWSNSDPGNDDPLDVIVWRKAPVEPSFLLRDRRDPFQVLGVDEDNLPAPAAAWDI